MSMVSFLNTDVTQIRFSDNIVWRGKDNFQIIEETWLEENAEKTLEDGKKVRLGGGGGFYRFIETYGKTMRFEEDMMKPANFL